ncbi:MAG: recombination mediator RecR [Simkaniaceae bacterium]|nr:recombination mediator RecR [Simkaniaceae bacterium]
MKRYPQPLNALISYFKKFPGVGQKSAERFAFHLLNWKESDIQKFSSHLSLLKTQINPCLECSAFLEDGKCPFCDSTDRDQKSLCILSSVKDVYAIEETHIFNGLYHIIPKLLSPLDGDYEEQIKTDLIKERVQKRGIREMIIALDSTLEGDATALYIKGELENMNLVISRLAFGLPLGSSLDFVDEGTLNRAILGRQPL